MVYIFVDDHLLRKRIERERSQLEADLSASLNELDRLCEQIGQSADAQEREQLSLLKDFHHGRDDVSKGGSRDYRMRILGDLKNSNEHLSLLIEILRANPGLSPTEAKKRIKDFLEFLRADQRPR